VYKNQRFFYFYFGEGVQHSSPPLGAHLARSFVAFTSVYFDYYGFSAF